MDLAVERLQSLRVADVMTRRLNTVPAEYTLSQTAALFVDKDISWAPVVNRSGECVGVLSATDFLKRETLSQEAGGGDTSRTGRARVEDCMSDAIQSIAPHAGILHAARIMCAQHLHRLLVLDERGKPVGVISSMDITAALVNSMDEMRLGGFSGAFRAGDRPEWTAR